MTTTDQHPVTVALSKQLEVATDINACFCIGCGQPDEPELHDPARCPAREGGKLDVLTVADALEVYDTSCDEEPDLDGDARALHCAIVATRLASVSSASAEKPDVRAFVDSYEFRADDGDHTPTEAERALIEDAIHGYLAASPEPVPATNQAGEVEDPAKIALDAYNQGYRDGCEDSGGEADAESSRDGFHDWLHDYKMPEPGNAFAIDLPSNEGRAEVRKQDDGKWQVFVVSENAFEGGYRSAWNLPTFEAAVRNIMDVLWEGCLPFDAPALATQPATSQPEEAWMNDPRSLDAGLPATSQEGANEDGTTDFHRQPCVLSHVAVMRAVETNWNSGPDNLVAAILALAATPTPPTLSEDLREAERLREEVAFLLARSGQAGKFTFGGKRWTGVSSNALVSIAFGEPEEALPSDSSDLAACYRAVMRLPMHRRTDAVFDHLETGERYVEGKYEGSIEWAREDAEWPGRAALAQVKAS